MVIGLWLAESRPVLRVAEDVFGMSYQEALLAARNGGTLAFSNTPSFRTEAVHHASFGLEARRLRDEPTRAPASRLELHTDGHTMHHAISLSCSIVVVTRIATASFQHGCASGSQGEDAVHHGRAGRACTAAGQTGDSAHKARLSRQLAGDILLSQRKGRQSASGAIQRCQPEWTRLALPRGCRCDVTTFPDLRMC